MTDGRVSRRRMLAAVGIAGFAPGCVGPFNQSKTDTNQNNTDTNQNNSEPSDEGNDATTIFVDPNGDDQGSGSQEDPLETIQKALEVVQPGNTIKLNPGDYTDPWSTVTAGKPDAPITLTGPKEAVLRPSPEAIEEQFNPFYINHSHYQLTGVTINGLQNPSAPQEVDSYAVNLLTIQPNHDTEEYIENVRIAPYGIGNCQTKLILLVRGKNCEFGPFKVIGPAGTDYLYGDKVSHIGEIIYIGQPYQRYAGYEWPWETYDQTRDIYVHHIDNSEGYHHAELVDIKDGSRNVTVEYCTDSGGSQNTEPWPSQSINVRGHNCTIRWNRLAGGKGRGINLSQPTDRELFPEIGFDEEVFNDIGTENEIYGNEIHDFDEGPFYIDQRVQDSQRYMCGNDLTGDAKVDAEESCPDSLPTGEGIGHTGGDSPYA